LGDIYVNCFNVTEGAGGGKWKRMAIKRTDKKDGKGTQEKRRTELKISVQDISRGISTTIKLKLSL
jgi:hypothetical protein